MLEPLSNQPLISTLLVLLAIALLSDIRDRRIPNVLVVIGLVAGLAGHTWFAGLSGFMAAGSGACVGLLCLLPFYISGGMGAGDIKLMAMCGAFLGPLYVAVAAVASLTVGGVLGMLWSFWYFRTTEDDHFEDETHSISVAASAGNQAAAPAAIPYALVIAAGVLISLKAAPITLLALKGGISW